MFKKSLKITTIFTFILFAFAACKQQTVEKEDVKPVAPEEEFGKFSKRVTIGDKEKRNFVTLSYYCDDKNILDQYDENSFELMPVHNNNLPDLGGDSENTVENSSTQPVGDKTHNLFTLDIVIEEEKLADGVSGFILRNIKSRQPSVRSSICDDPEKWESTYTYNMYKYSSTGAFVYSKGWTIRGTLYSKGYGDWSWGGSDWYAQACATLCGGWSKGLYPSNTYYVKLKVKEYYCNDKSSGAGWL